MIRGKYICRAGIILAAYAPGTARADGGHVVGIEANSVIVSFGKANALVNRNVNRDVVFNDDVMNAYLEQNKTQPQV